VIRKKLLTTSERPRIQEKGQNLFLSASNRTFSFFQLAEKVSTGRLEIPADSFLISKTWI